MRCRARRDFGPGGAGARRPEDGADAGSHRWVGKKLKSPKLKRFLRRLRSRYRVERVILFGSRARGHALRESDTDLLIVSPDFREVHFNDRVTGILDFWAGSSDLEPLCFTPEEFERKRRAIGIVRTAVEEGVEL